MSRRRLAPPDADMVRMFRSRRTWTNQQIIDHYELGLTSGALSWHRRRLRPKWIAGGSKDGVGNMSDEEFWGTVRYWQMQRVGE